MTFIPKQGEIIEVSNDQEVNYEQMRFIGFYHS